MNQTIAGLTPWVFTASILYALLPMLVAFVMWPFEPAHKWAGTILAAVVAMMSLALVWAWDIVFPEEKNISPFATMVCVPVFVLMVRSHGFGLLVFREGLPPAKDNPPIRVAIVLTLLLSVATVSFMWRVWQRLPSA